MDECIHLMERSTCAICSPARAVSGGTAAPPSRTAGHGRRWRSWLHLALLRCSIAGHAEAGPGAGLIRVATAQGLRW